VNPAASQLIGQHFDPYPAARIAGIGGQPLPDVAAVAGPAGSRVQVFGSSLVNLLWSVVAAREQEFRPGLEGLGARHDPPEGSGHPIDDIEGEADRERVLDLLA
jgi:hypothetical protein